MIRSPTFSPAAPTKIPPPSFVAPAAKHSPPGPRSPAWRWLHSRAVAGGNSTHSRLPLFHRRQVDGALARHCGSIRLETASVDGDELAGNSRLIGPRVLHQWRRLPG